MFGLARQLMIGIVLAGLSPVWADDLFEQRIRPVLVQHCIKCHGARKQEGGLRLDSSQAMLAGGDNGPAISRSAPKESLLLEALRYESFEMPPSGQLDQRIIGDFETWLATGAEWPEHEEALRATSEITSEDRQWWAFQPLSDAEPPRVDTGWVCNPIDQFVWHELQSHDLHPAPPADRLRLLRRVYFDLLGVPPNLEEIQEFVEDDSAHAWESLIDRLLDDPRYGEHWGRHWLDLVRYSESDGWNQDAYRPHIWRYRDYVIDSFNDDKPYTEFVREQLAGDQLDGDDPAQLTATGFLRLGIYEYNQRDARGLWNDILNETTDVVGDAFLGLSLACARCHDHKFDPVLQTDYFRVRAHFEPLIWRDDLVAATDDEQSNYVSELAKWEAATADIRDQINSLLDPYHQRKWESTVDKFPVDIQACFHMPVAERTSWQHQMAYLVSRQFEEEGGGPLKNMSKEDKAAHEQLLKQLGEFDALKPDPLPAVMAVRDFDGLHSPTFIPDDPQRKTVHPGALAVTLPEKAEFDATDVEPNRRLRLAEWIANPDNALTQRVIVNRVWQHHFGKGLVSTPNDFGRQGSQPSHPDLLDWLTREFIANGFSIKYLHRLILQSATWRQSAEHPLAEQYEQIDLQEQLIWRSRVRRLQAEQIRDAMLATSGELIAKRGGPSVEQAVHRRSVYLKSFRNKNDTFLHGFDMANGLKSVAVRDSTTTPTQALLMINGQYARDRAGAMAKRLSTVADSTDPESVLRSAFHLAWGRDPSPQQMTAALTFLSASGAESADGQEDLPKEERYVDFCHVLFNSNQFLYVD